HKLAAMAAGVSEALRERGVGDPGATILGELAIAIFRVSFERWTAERSGPDLNELMRESLGELHALTAGGALSGARGGNALRAATRSREEGSLPAVSPPTAAADRRSSPRACRSGSGLGRSDAHRESRVGARRSRSLRADRPRSRRGGSSR